MDRPLRIVYRLGDENAELPQRVHETLDVLADVIERFELVLIHDAASDAAFDVAHELEKRYPQVRVMAERELEESDSMQACRLLDGPLCPQLVLRVCRAVSTSNGRHKISAIPAERGTLRDSPTSPPPSRLRIAELRRRQKQEARKGQHRLAPPSESAAASKPHDPNWPGASVPAPRWT